MDTKGGKRGVMNWEIGIDIYTLICIKWITNKKLLYKKINKIKFKNSKKIKRKVVLTKYLKKWQNDHKHAKMLAKPKQDKRNQYKLNNSWRRQALACWLWNDF